MKEFEEYDGFISPGPVVFISGCFDDEHPDFISSEEDWGILTRFGE